ncbi:DUF4031 domain-containing protein [Kocuria sp. ZOR0020]|uniref:DUF4031 domain-containing protein n=1 Tax=Kocuria sp. ZOR0020 TaxID=1339234 RepID=UPI0009DFB5C2
MPVYIDPPRWPAHGTEFSHLISDTSLEELHAAAERIGLSPRAFDRDHYDVPRQRYDDAVAAGAVEVDGKQLVRILVASGLRIPAARRNNKVLTALRRRWDGAVGVTEPLQRLRETLLAGWGEEHRHYHDRTHLLAVLATLDELTDGSPPLEVVLAAWFHDVVYEGQAGADEEASAQFALSTLPQVGMDQDTADEVARLVRMTTHHNPDPQDTHGALLSDADLAVLGGTPERYADYVQRVRAEYPQVPEYEFVHARLLILDRLDPAALYKTERGRALWGEQARLNLAVEIDELRLGSLARIQVPEWCKVLPIVGMCFVRDGHLLTVRKRDTEMFMLVGGKIEDGETALAAGVREITEEVGLVVAPEHLELLGEFDAPAANESATWIDSTVFVVTTPVQLMNDDDAPTTPDPSAQAEIEELRHLDLYPDAVSAAEDTLAPLIRRQVLPMLRRRDSRFWSAHVRADSPYRLAQEPQG